MSNAYLCPILQQNQFTDNANFLAGGLLWSYVAGTTTPQAVYTDSTANTAWPNPIVLDQRGETGGEIWLAAGSEYKFILEEAPFYGETHGPTVATFDNISGINDSSALTIAPNWITFTGTPTYISSTSFSVAGDQRPTFQIYRRVKSANSGGTMYGSVSTATYATGITTITLINDTGDALDSGLNSVAYGFIETDPSSIPPSFPSGTTMLFVQAAAPAGWTKVTSHNDYALRIVSGTGGGTGGSVAFTTAFANTNAGSTTLSVSQIPGHMHPGRMQYEQWGGGSSQANSGPPSGSSQGNAANSGYTDWLTGSPGGNMRVASEGSGSSHTHSLTLAVNYIDSIICTKD